MNILSRALMPIITVIVIIIILAFLIFPRITKNRIKKTPKRWGFKLKRQWDIEKNTLKHQSQGMSKSDAKKRAKNDWFKGFLGGLKK